MWLSPVRAIKSYCKSYLKKCLETRSQGLPKSGFSSVGKLNFRDILAGKKRTSLFTNTHLSYDTVPCKAKYPALDKNCAQCRDTPKEKKEKLRHVPGNWFTDKRSQNALHTKVLRKNIEATPISRRHAVTEHKTGDL